MPLMPLPGWFLCSITHEPFVDPVCTVDGQAYERKVSPHHRSLPVSFPSVQAIEEWLAKHDTSPLTNLPLASKLLVPNLYLKQMVQERKNKLCSLEAFRVALRAASSSLRPSTSRPPICPSPLLGRPSRPAILARLRWCRGCWSTARRWTRWTRTRVGRLCIGAAARPSPRRCSNTRPTSRPRTRTASR